MIRTCEACGETIHLRATRAGGVTFRWYAGSSDSSWHCGTDPHHPTLAHAPKEA